MRPWDVAGDLKTRGLGWMCLFRTAHGCGKSEVFPPLFPTQGSLQEPSQWSQPAAGLGAPSHPPKSKGEYDTVSEMLKRCNFHLFS